jgi:hypothetical protein
MLRLLRRSDLLEADSVDDIQLKQFVKARKYPMTKIGKY